MDVKKKPNDILVATMSNTGATLLDFAQNNITFENTLLLSKDEYKSSDYIKKAFTENGKFNEDKFDLYYNLATQNYLNLQDDHDIDVLSDFLKWDEHALFKPEDALTRDLLSKSIKTNNPQGLSIGWSEPNVWSEQKKTNKELALQNRIWDSKNKKWLNVTPESRSIIDNFFGDTLYYAQYLKEGIQTNPVTGETGYHYAGEWMTDDKGNFFTMTAGNQDILNNQVVSVWDTLTKEDSWINKYDFMDSDDRDKSLTGIVARNSLVILPYLIPQLRPIWGAATMGIGIASSAPTLFKSVGAIFGSDNTNEGYKALTTWENYFRKWNLENSKSEKGSLSFWNAESIGSLIADTWGQLYQLQAAANLVAWALNYNKTAKAVLQGTATLETIKKLERMQKTLGSFALAFMGLEESARAYNDALNAGYDTKTAGWTGMLTALSLFGVMRFNEGAYSIGTWALRQFGEGDLTTRGINRLVWREVESELGDISKGFSSLIKSGDKKLLAKASWKFRYKAISTLDKLYKGRVSGIAGAFFSEGLEEVTEEMIQDAVKGAIDACSALGWTPSLGSFGGWSNVFSKEGIERYISTFVGGGLGGAMFRLQSTKIDPFMNRLVGKETAPIIDYNNYEVIEAILEGRGQLLIDESYRIEKKLSRRDNSPLVFTTENGDIQVSDKSAISSAMEAFRSDVKKNMALVQSYLPSTFYTEHGSKLQKDIIKALQLGEPLKDNETLVLHYLKTKLTNIMQDVVNKNSDYKQAKAEYEAVNDADKKDAAKLKMQNAKEALDKAAKKSVDFFNGKLWKEDILEIGTMHDEYFRTVMSEMANSNMTAELFYNKFYKKSEIIKYKDLTEEEKNKINSEKLILGNATGKFDRWQSIVPIMALIYDHATLIFGPTILNFINNLHKKLFIQHLLNSPILQEFYDNEENPVGASNRLLMNLINYALMNTPNSFTLSDRLNFDIAEVLIKNNVIKDFDLLPSDIKDLVKLVINDFAVNSRINIWDENSIAALLGSVSNTINDGNTPYNKKLRELDPEIGINLEIDTNNIKPGSSVYAELTNSRISSFFDYASESDIVSRDLFETTINIYLKYIDSLISGYVNSHTTRYTYGYLSINIDLNSPKFTLDFKTKLDYAVDILTDMFYDESLNPLGIVIEEGKEVENIIKEAIDYNKAIEFSQKPTEVNPLEDIFKSVFFSLNGEMPSSTMLNFIRDKGELLTKIKDGAITEEDINKIDNYIHTLKFLSSIINGMTQKHVLEGKGMRINLLMNIYTNLWNEGSKVPGYSVIDVEDASLLGEYIYELESKITTLKNIKVKSLEITKEDIARKKKDTEVNTILYLARYISTDLPDELKPEIPATEIDILDLFFKKEKTFGELILNILSTKPGDTKLEKAILIIKLSIYNKIIELSKDTEFIADKRTVLNDSLSSDLEIAQKYYILEVFTSLLPKSDETAESQNAIWNTNELPFERLWFDALNPDSFTGNKIHLLQEIVAAISVSAKENSKVLTLIQTENPDLLYSYDFEFGMSLILAFSKNPKLFNFFTGLLKNNIYSENSNQFKYFQNKQRLLNDIMIYGAAGSGKSTMISLIAKHLGRRIYVSAIELKKVNDLSMTLNTENTAKTIDDLFNVLYIDNHFKSIRNTIINTLTSFKKDEFTKENIQSKLKSLKGISVSINGDIISITADLSTDENHLIGNSTFNIELNGVDINLKDITFDFTDEFKKSIRAKTTESNEVLIIDEATQLSDFIHEILLTWAEINNRIIIRLGDPRLVGDLVLSKNNGKIQDSSRDLYRYCTYSLPPMNNNFRAANTSLHVAIDLLGKVYNSIKLLNTINDKEYEFNLNSIDLDVIYDDSDLDQINTLMQAVVDPTTYTIKNNKLEGIALVSLDNIFDSILAVISEDTSRSKVIITDLNKEEISNFINNRSGLSTEQKTKLLESINNNSISLRTLEGAQGGEWDYVIALNFKFNADKLVTFLKCYTAITRAKHGFVSLIGRESSFNKIDFKESIVDDNIAVTTNIEKFTNAGKERAEILTELSKNLPTKIEEKKIPVPESTVKIPTSTEDQLVDDSTSDNNIEKENPDNLPFFTEAAISTEKPSEKNINNDTKELNNIISKIFNETDLKGNNWSKNGLYYCRLGQELSIEQENDIKRALNYSSWNDLVRSVNTLYREKKDIIKEGSELDIFLIAIQNENPIIKNYISATLRSCHNDIFSLFTNFSEWVMYNFKEKGNIPFDTYFGLLLKKANLAEDYLFRKGNDFDPLNEGDNLRLFLIKIGDGFITIGRLGYVEENDLNSVLAKLEKLALQDKINLRVVFLFDPNKLKLHREKVTEYRKNRGLSDNVQIPDVFVPMTGLRLQRRSKEYNKVWQSRYGNPKIAERNSYTLSELYAMGVTIEKLFINPKEIEDVINSNNFGDFDPKSVDLNHGKYALISRPGTSKKWFIKINCIDDNFNITNTYKEQNKEQTRKHLSPKKTEAIVYFIYHELLGNKVKYSDVVANITDILTEIENDKDKINERINSFNGITKDKKDLIIKGFNNLINYLNSPLALAYYEYASLNAYDPLNPNAFNNGWKVKSANLNDKSVTEKIRKSLIEAINDFINDLFPSYFYKYVEFNTIEDLTNYEDSIVVDYLVERGDYIIDWSLLKIVEEGEGSGTMNKEVKVENKEDIPVTPKPALMMTFESFMDSYKDNIPEWLYEQLLNKQLNLPSSDEEVLLNYPTKPDIYKIAMRKFLELIKTNAVDLSEIQIVGLDMEESLIETGLLTVNEYVEIKRNLNNYTLNCK